MKAKLLSLVSPMPASAFLAADFEALRASIYNVELVEEDVLVPEPIDLPAQQSGRNMCSWCGIWQPLPSPTIINTQQSAVDNKVELGDQPTEASSEAVE